MGIQKAHACRGHTIPLIGSLLFFDRLSGENYRVDECPQIDLCTICRRLTYLCTSFFLPDTKGDLEHHLYPRERLVRGSEGLGMVFRLGIMPPAGRVRRGRCAVHVCSSPVCYSVLHHRRREEQLDQYRVVDGAAEQGAPLWAEPNWRNIGVEVGDWMQMVPRIFEVVDAVDVFVVVVVRLSCVLGSHLSRYSIQRSGA